MEAAAPSASSPRVPGSGVEEPGSWWCPVGAEHQLGIALQVASPECAAGAPIAIRAQPNKPNMMVRIASPAYFVWQCYYCKVRATYAKCPTGLRSFGCSTIRRGGRL